VQPAQPEGLDSDGVLRGMYLLAPATAEHERRAQILASGVAVPWALKAQRLLAEEWGVAADVWSVTSWTELRRDGLAVDRHNLFSPTEEPRRAYVTERLADRPGPVVAVSDYMNALQDMIRPWVPGDFATLGTDGWGRSDTRGALRRHFLVDAESIVCRTLLSLAERGEVDRGVVRDALDRYRLWDPTAADAGNTEGGG
jgi:pyruvate dehydrogenase E1 component